MKTDTSEQEKRVKALINIAKHSDDFLDEFLFGETVPNQQKEGVCPKCGLEAVLHFKTNLCNDCLQKNIQETRTW